MKYIPRIGFAADTTLCLFEPPTENGADVVLAKFFLRASFGRDVWFLKPW